MKAVLWFDLQSGIKDIKNIWAHIRKGKPPETLAEHSSLTRKYFLKLLDEKCMGRILDNIIENMTCRNKVLEKECIELIKEMLANAVFLHDMGKINPAYQKEKMKNPKYKGTDETNSEHSLLSALIYIDIFQAKIKKMDRRMQNYLHNILYSFAYQISRHHTYLKDTDDFLERLQTVKEKGYLENYISSTVLDLDLGENNKFNFRFESYDLWKMDGLAFYILNKLLFSLIVACDFYATHQYETGKEVELGLIENPEDLLEVYGEYRVRKGIEEYRRDRSYFSSAPINALRSELFIEAEKNLLENINQNIFYLEAPTGGGKTNISVNLALNLVKHSREHRKIFYIFPFNTLVEQTKETLEEVFAGHLDFAVINSITPVVTRVEEKLSEGDGDIDYEKSYLDRQFLHYPLVVTTHIAFFNYLFGTGREVNLPLAELCNSVVILDEIQSYRNFIWKEIILFLYKYAKLLNIKFIIMSATLPRLDKLLMEGRHSENFVSLIPNCREVYGHPLFKDRVTLDYSLMEQKEMNFEKLEESLLSAIRKRGSPSKVLVEFIRKDTARGFFQYMREKHPKDKIMELSGDDNKFIRKAVLKEIKASDSILVIATQVIEAGVDIDMDLGFKDSSLMDSEEQFLGRINRSCLKPDCRAYFFNMDKAENIYRQDFRVGEDLTKEKYRKCLENKDFTEFYRECFKRIELGKSGFNSENIDNLLDKALQLRFKEIQEKMRLITQQTFQIYIPYRLETEAGAIDGHELWEGYLKVLKDRDMGYGQRQVELSVLYEKMSCFTYNLIAHEKLWIEEAPPFTVREGNFYYFEKGGEYIEEGKFDRKKYMKDAGGLFL